MIRPAWLKIVVDASQKLAGHCESLGPDDAHATLTTFVRALPRPTGHLERLLLRALLLEAAWRCGHILHGRAGRTHEDQGALVRTKNRAIDAFWRASAHDPQRAFLGWVDAFSAEYARTFPQSAASRAARAIRDHYQLPWSVAALAGRFHVTPSHLRRTFQQEFRVSIHQYQRAVRLIEAMKLMPTGKIDAIARLVGYKSKKNFYRALQHVTGLTPTAFRNLSEQRALQIVESLGAAPPRRSHRADRRRRSGTIAEPRAEGE